MPETIDEIFSEKLRAELAIRPHGFQMELASAVGLSKSRLNNLIKGRRGSTEDVRRAICKVIGRDYEEFLFGNLAAGARVDPALAEFIKLFARYGSPALLEMCIAKLQAIKDMVEGGK